MTIDQLLAAVGLTANDEIPLWDAEESGEPTKKITAQNLAAAVKLLASLLAKSDVKDSLSNTSIDYPLSANQGKVLNDKANTILSDIAAVYDSTATYAIGDLCIYQNALYKCTTAITAAEAWNAAHWTATTLDDMTVKYGDIVNNLTRDDPNPVSSGAVYNAIANFGKFKQLTPTQFAFSGQTVKYNIDDNCRLLRFTAHAFGIGVASIINIVNGTIYITNLSNSSISASVSNNVLTITMPQSDYWGTSMEVLPWHTNS